MIRHVWLLIFLGCVIVQGCSGVSRELEETKRQDSIEAYERFLSKHPDSGESEWMNRRIHELKDREKKIGSIVAENARDKKNLKNDRGPAAKKVLPDQERNEEEKKSKKSVTNKQAPPNKELVRAIKRELVRLHYPVQSFPSVRKGGGVIGMDVNVRLNGDWDSQTVEAIKGFERWEGLKVRGEATQEILDRLRVAEPMPLDKPGLVFRDCPECPQLVVVPPGQYRMGNLEMEKTNQESSVHDIIIDYSLAVGIFEVTFEEWDACFTWGGCRRKPSDDGFGRGRRPVYNVKWKETQAYITWLSRRTGFKYRLLSESEWEYVARAGSETKYFFGDSVHDLCLYANPVSLISSIPLESLFTRESISKQCQLPKNIVGKALPVGTFLPNTFGLFDVHGNVGEWVQDCWNPNYTGAPVDGVCMA